MQTPRPTLPSDLRVMSGPGLPVSASQPSSADPQQHMAGGLQMLCNSARFAMYAGLIAMHSSSFQSKYFGVRYLVSALAFQTTKSLRAVTGKRMRERPAQAFSKTNSKACVMTLQSCTFNRTLPFKGQCSDARQRPGCKLGLWIEL